MEYSVNINGLDIKAYYSDKSINEILIPLLKDLSDLYKGKGSRVLVMLAAPPGAGKSTLASFLEYLAKDIIPEIKVQAIGMDGFHRRQEYLLSHSVEIDGKNIQMVKIKGAPITFDLEKFKDNLKELKTNDVYKWPIYDRMAHNPIEDALNVDGDIVILEGNYLLLDMDGWKDLKDNADYTISLSADEKLLRERLIERKMMTGVDRENTVKFVDFSDMANVRLCVNKTMKADLELILSEDGTEILKKSL